MFAFNQAYASQYWEFSQGTNETCTSLLTTSENRAATLGWNCFDVELAYDPSIKNNNHLSISFFDQNISSLTLNGYLYTDTNGSIISSNINNTAEPLISLIGSYAKDAIQKAYDEGVKVKKEPATRSAIGGLLGSLGAHKLIIYFHHLLQDLTSRMKQKAQ